MRNIIFFLAFVVSLTAHAGHVENTYVGGMYGFSTLNHDLKGEAYEFIATNPQATQLNTVLHALGGNIDITSNQNSTFRKLFVGHRFNRFVGLELFYVKMHSYAAKAQANINVSPTASGGAYNVNLYGNIDGSYKASADFTGVGLRVNGFLPVSDKFDLMAGFGIMDASSIVKTSYDLNASYNYNAAYYVSGYTDSISGGDSFNETGGSSRKITGTVPVFSLGMIYHLTHHLTIRAEIERYGHPIERLSIDTMSAGLQYAF